MINEKLHILINDISGREISNFSLDTIEMVEKIQVWEHDEVKQFEDSVRVRIKFLNK